MPKKKTQPGRKPDLVIITGLSGSGKSSLAFDTLFAEGQRRYIETFSPYARQFFDRRLLFSRCSAVDRLFTRSAFRIAPFIAILQHLLGQFLRGAVNGRKEVGA